MTGRRYKPMLAQSADAPFDSKDWMFEVKWDGIRAIGYTGGEVSVRSRNDLELIGRFPELTELSDLTGPSVLDGEIVMMRDGKPEIQTLLSRVQKNNPGEIAGLARQFPVTYVVFDILEKDGISLIDRPLRERRGVLASSLEESAHVAVSVPVEEKGRDYYAVVTGAGLEGIMAKRLDSVYEPGQRSSSWLKIKERRTCDCIIFGYTGGTGARAGSFGALILGLYEQGKPVYVGKVGTGFPDDLIRALLAEFRPLVSTGPTLHGVPEDHGITWLIPAIVCEVAYQSVTRDRRLRMPRFIRTRPDKTPEECSTAQLVMVRPVLTGKSLMRGTTGNEKSNKEAGGNAEEIRDSDGSPKGGRKATGTGRKEDESTLVNVRTGEGKPGEMTTGKKQEEDSVEKAGRTREDKAMKKDEKAGTTPGPEGPLKEYQEKRDFSTTTEPAGSIIRSGKGDMFVVHEHHASHLHWDLRLERDGVLKSWAVPKGIPAHPGEPHLAIETEDHPLEYGTFEGEIPKGQYGAGTVSIWDTGTYETIKWTPEKIELVMHGRKLDGMLALIRFRKAGAGEWLLIRGKD